MRHSLFNVFEIFAWLAIGPLLMGTPACGVDQAVEPNSAPKSIVILGDSLAAGYGLDPDEAFPALLQKRIDDKGFPGKIVAAGLSGDTTAGGLRRLEWILRRPVDLLLVELGGNDGLRGVPVSATRTNLLAIIDRTRARYPQARIVVAGMRMPPNLGQEYTEAFQNVFREVAQSRHVDLIPFLLDGVGGKPELNLPDGIHPTAEGHKIVAETIWKVMNPILTELNPNDRAPKK